MSAASNAVPSTQQSVVITGASTGIGFHAAGDLVSRGFRVFGTVRRVEDGERLKQAGVIPILLDVTDAASIALASSSIEEQLQGAPLVALVNNAGITLAGPVELLDLGDFRQVFEVNMFGVVAVTKAFLPLLKASRGRIVNISSSSVWLRPPFNSSYVASKCALEAFSDCLRRELHPYGIDVVIIQPGNVDTEIWRKGVERDVSRAIGTIYESQIAVFKGYAKTMKRMPPSRTSAAIHTAITARRPPIRLVVVGRRLRQLIMRWLPERMKDRQLINRFWGHHSTKSTRQ
jgi:NAD(P)-dependent dehydrogenase (short-subunit alcohol dehydrogenase family)